MPSVSRPAAVRVTERGAEPDDVEVERLMQDGDLFVEIVGTAVGGTVMVAVVPGEGDVVVVIVGDGDVVSQVLGVIESCNPEELPEL